MIENRLNTQTDTQTDRHAHHNTPLPYREGVSNKNSNNKNIVGLACLIDAVIDREMKWLDTVKKDCAAMNFIYSFFI